MSVMNAHEHNNHQLVFRIPIMSQSSTLKGQCIAEFLGTGLLIFFGVGVLRR
jgi:hypothetical protein